MLLMFCVFFCVSVLLTFNKERVESGRRKKNKKKQNKNSRIVEQETPKLVDNCITVPSFVLFMVPDRYFIFSLSSPSFEAKSDC